MTRKLLGLLFALPVLCAGAAAYSNAVAQTIELNPDRPDRYTVVRGDTLWDISGRFLREPWRWPEIWRVNSQIANPHLIYPGDVVALGYRNGFPELRLERAGELGSALRLSPDGRRSVLESTIPTIPIDVIQPFLTKPRVVSLEEMENAPYIIASADGRLASAEGDRVYARGLEQAGAQGTGARFSVYRLGGVYIDPETADAPALYSTVHSPAKDAVILGYEAIYIGEANVEQSGDPATLSLVESEREVLIGDRLLLPDDQGFARSFLPYVANVPVEGQIISVVGGVSRIGQHQVVALNLGRQDDLKIGQVLAVYQQGQALRDTVNKEQRGETIVVLPEVHAGVLMVFRVFDRVSYALVMEATRPLRLYDVVRNP